MGTLVYLVGGEREAWKGRVGTRMKAVVMVSKSDGDKDGDRDGVEEEEAKEKN